MPAQRSIGQVLSVLKSQFPDVSISKIRFLESEGLVSPERAPSGYRKYSDADVERLRYILRVQKEHYLPLKVIREHLDMMDRGMEPPVIEAPAPLPPTAVPSASAPTGPASAASATSPNGGPAASRTAPAAQPPLRLSRAELLRSSGLSEAALVELERQMILVPRRGKGFYDRDALTIAMVARRLSDFGMDVRHMRAFKIAAEREAGLIEQAIAPFQRRGTAAGRNVAADVVKLVGIAHSALLRSALDR
ncbi:MerR family transcriptional regulator [Auraticoccus sp. F435]|uniref:MerR family transcriptional regulator n=1 Tax=Auraticoccus cholistanensis TaxID=2656650 RepID=A0A6A9UVZ1_9ACTN|nr:MerR family transcriptional regulator [Auraticoccus cholistanensis]MVA75792.1 MerR family transcriptional regulator [Auraticoccus cholistanensis]